MRSLSSWCVCALTLLSLAVGAPLYAQDVEGARGSSFEIEADQIEYDQPREVYEAAGNVVIEQSDGRTLSADWVTFNARTRVGVAVGDVILRDGDDVVRADFATVDLENLTALATHASMNANAPGFLVTGDAVQKTGDNTYSIEGGVFTTCRCPPESKRRPWEIGVGEADIEVEGYAIARDVTFRVLGWPLLYTPWLILPVKTERQTGLLIPTFEASGRNGAQIETPVFVAVGERMNLIARPRWLAKRGFQGALETEYVFGEIAEGAGGVSILPSDDEVEDDPQDKRYNSDRWAYWLRHEQPLAEGVRVGADVRAISDNDYVVDFEDLGSQLRNKRFLESKAWASFARGSTYAGVQALGLDDLQNPNDSDRDDFLLQRLPEVTAAVLPRALGPLPLLAGLDLRYTYFYKRKDPSRLRGNLPTGGQFFDTGRDGLFDADEPGVGGSFPGTDVHLDNQGNPAGSRTEGDGIFQVGELLSDHGHRVDLAPRVVLPFHLGPIETLSEVGFRETLYFPDRASSETRELWTGRVDARMRFSRDFRVGTTPVRHLMEPKVSFTAVSGDHQQRNPLFVPEGEQRLRRLIDADPRLLTRNPSDRVGDERVFLASIDNRIYGSRLGEGSRPRTIGSFRVGTGFDFLLDRMTDLFVDASVHPNPNLELEVSSGYDIKKRRFDEALSSISWQSEERYTLRTTDELRRHSVTVQHRYLRDRNRFFEDFKRGDDVFEQFDNDLDRVDQLSMGTRFAAARQLDLFASGFISFEDNSTRSGSIGFMFISSCGCWDLSAEIQRRIRPADTRFGFNLRLAGLGFLPSSD